jgi:hypothetical protein
MTPENAGYYHAAYVVAVVLYVGYAWSVWWRRRRIARLRRGKPS